MILRIVAIAIAVAGLVDPAITVTRAALPPLTIAIVRAPALERLHANGETGLARAYRAAAALTDHLGGQFAVSVREHLAAASSDPCSPDSACVIVSDGTAPRALEPRARVLAGIRIGDTSARNIAIAAVDVAPLIDRDAVATLDARIVGRGAAGAATKVDVFDGDVPLGTSTYTWPASGAETEAVVRVDWTPLFEGARTLRVSAGALDGESVMADNEGYAATTVAPHRRKVLVYDPQPSWPGTFVRRALESDPRFEVETHARLGLASAVSTRSFRLTADHLETSNVALLVVSTPQSLSRAELAAIDNWTRLRGGSVVLLLAASPAGEVRALIGARGEARRERTAVQAGSLRASEFVLLEPERRGVSPMVALDDRPVITITPSGRGRVIASGALDAWRFRDVSGFDAFWRGTAAEAAAATGERLAIALSRYVTATGERVDADVEWRSTREWDGPLDASATLRCASSETPIRLWPAARRGAFTAAIDPPEPGLCQLRVQVGELGAATANLQVFDRPRGPLDVSDRLSAAVAAFGGEVVEAGDEARLATALRALATPVPAAVTVHPLRSGWWMMPFAGCLGLEWWLRRRRGLR